MAAAADHDLEIALEYTAWTTPADPARAVAMALVTGARVVVDVLHHVRVGAGVDELRAVVESGLLGWGSAKPRRGQPSSTRPTPPAVIVSSPRPATAALLASLSPV